MRSLNGDAAVARLDAAVDAFLQIITAPEGEMVPVPGHPDQPSLAERTKQNLKPSTEKVGEMATAAAESAELGRSAAAQADDARKAIELAASGISETEARIADLAQSAADHAGQAKASADKTADALAKTDIGHVRECIVSQATSLIRTQAIMASYHAFGE